MLWTSNLFLHLVWKNLLSETSLGESYILIIYRHLDTKKKHSLDVQGVYNMLRFIKKADYMFQQKIEDFKCK